MKDEMHKAIDDMLKSMGLERTRENYLFVMYDGNVPEDDWDQEAEDQLPVDLRLSIS